MISQFVFVFFIFCSKVCSSKVPSIAKLDKNAIAELVNDEEAIAKWDYILNKNIIYNDKYHTLKAYIDHSTGEIKDFNVLSIIKKYITSDDMDKHVSIDDIRRLIQDAIDCAGLTHTNIFAMIIIRDLLPYIKASNIHNTPPSKKGLPQDKIDAIKKKIQEEPDNNSEDQSLYTKVKHILDSEEENNIIEKEKNTKTKFNIKTCESINNKYHIMNFNIVTDKSKTKLNGFSTLQGNKLEMCSTWENIIRKRTTLNIVYRINPEEFDSIFNPFGTVHPAVVELYEIVCVLIFKVLSIDELLQKNCVAPNESFVKKYKSLNNELGEEFIKFLKELDGDEHIIWKIVCELSSQLEILGEAPKETSEETLEESSEKVLKETSGDALEETLKEAPKETSEEALEKASEDALEETLKEAPKETSEKALEEQSGKVQKETSEDALEETLKEAPKETSEETLEEPSEKVQKETSDDALEETSKEAPKETSEEAPEKTSEEALEEPSEKVQKETSEDALEETLKETPKETSEETLEEPSEDALEETLKEAPKETSEQILDKTVDDDIMYYVLDEIYSNARFYLHQSHFKKDHTKDVYLNITYNEDEEEESRFENATIRKLSFSTSFENDFADKDFKCYKANRKAPDEEKTEVWYYFKGTVNVSLS